MSIRDLLVVQAGTNDSDWGTSVPPTVKLMGVTRFDFTPIVETQVFPEIKGSLAPGFEEALTRVGGQAELEAAVTYDDVPYYLDALFGQATATSDASDPNGVWRREYEAPLETYDSDLGNPRIFTLVNGDREAGATSSDTYGMAGSTLESLSISGETGAPLTLTASFIGKEIVNDALDSLSDRSVTMAMGDHVSLYIDPSSDTAGTTQLTTTAFSFNLNVASGRALKYHLGALTPSGYRDQKWSGTLGLSLELNSTTRAYLDDILNASAPLKKVVRIKASPNTSYELRFDFVGVVTAAPAIYTDNDGVVTVDIEFNGVYDATQGGWLTAFCKNTTETLA